MDGDAHGATGGGGRGLTLDRARGQDRGGAHRQAAADQRQAVGGLGGVGDAAADGGAAHRVHGGEERAQAPLRAGAAVEAPQRGQAGEVTGIQGLRQDGDERGGVLGGHRSHAVVGSDQRRPQGG